MSFGSKRRAVFLDCTPSRIDGSAARYLIGRKSENALSALIAFLKCAVHILNDDSLRERGKHRRGPLVSPIDETDPGLLGHGYPYFTA